MTNFALNLTRSEIIEDCTFALEVVGAIITFSSSKCGKYMFTKTWEGYSSKLVEQDDEFMWDIEDARTYWAGQVEQYGYKRIK